MRNNCVILRMGALLAVLVLSLSMLVGCANMVKGDEAKATVNEFLEALRVEDYGKAQSLMHPAVGDEDIEAFCDTLREGGIDLTKGVTDKKQTGFYSSLYNSDYDGSGYQMTFNAMVGEVKVTITTAVVRNADGYGIYQFHVDPKR